MGGLRNTRSGIETFLQYKFISQQVYDALIYRLTLAKLTNYCSRAKEWLQWTAEHAVGDLFYQMPIHICKQVSGTVKCYYLLFRKSWKVSCWICSLATIAIKQERCLLACQLSGFLIAFSWQWNKNVHNFTIVIQSILVACSPDFLPLHCNPFSYL